jgi:hypothetical protein
LNGCALSVAGRVLLLSVVQEHASIVIKNKSAGRNMVGDSELISTLPGFSFSDLHASLP